MVPAWAARSDFVDSAPPEQMLGTASDLGRPSWLQAAFVNLCVLCISRIVYSSSGLYRNVQFIKNVKIKTEVSLSL